MKQSTVHVKAGLLVVFVLFMQLVCIDRALAANSGGDTVCVQCHSSQSGRLQAPVAAWQRSVHARSGISCHSCHGGDPGDFALAMSPERGFLGVPQDSAIPDFCGRCHIGVREDYGLSAHGQALAKGGAHCVTCHGNHDIQVASVSLINQNLCSKCHEFARAEQIRAAVVETEQRLHASGERLPGLFRIGIATKPLADELFSIRNDFRRLFHRVQTGTVIKETDAFKKRITSVDEKISVIEMQLAQRKLIGAGIVALLICAGIVLLLIRRTYHAEEK